MIQGINLDEYQDVTLVLVKVSGTMTGELNSTVKTGHVYDAHINEDEIAVLISNSRVLGKIPAGGYELVQNSHIKVRSEHLQSQR